jgi:5-methylcytosine-specific restriction enzyme subunit McrC
MNTVVRLREGAPAAAVRLSGDQARRLAAASVVEVRPGPAAGIWMVRADRKVGALRIGDVDLYIAPKVSVARLLFLAGYARNASGWREQVISTAEQDEIVPAFADALWRQVDRATRAGLLQGYRAVDVTSTVLRGRLREAQQLGRRLGQPLPLEIRYDEFTADIAENRILATALERILRVPGVRPEARRMLRHLVNRFVSVTRIGRGEPLPAWRPSRLNARMHVALRLSELVLGDGAVDPKEGEVAANGLVLDMAWLFESFLSTALREQLERRYGGGVVAQSGGYLDELRRIPVRPDLIWRVDGRVAAVMDAKYKRDIPASDAYQMLAYCTAYDLPRGHLIYVTGGDRPIRHVVRNAGREIVCHSLNLDRPPDELLHSVGELADEIGQLGTAAGVIVR